MPEEKIPFEKTVVGTGTSSEIPEFTSEKETLPESPSQKETPSKREVVVGVEEATSAISSVSASIPSVKSPRLKAIENVLAEDLEDVYRDMSSKEQATFKQKGEKTAGKIETLLQATKINVRKVVALIYKWLKLIPGVNRYFLEQESKIKADKILRLRE